MQEAKPDKPIAQLTLPRQGMSQDQRLLQGLSPEYVKIDERDQEDLFVFLKALAEQLNFYSTNDQSADNNWSAFFPFDNNQAQKWLDEHKGNVSPHLAILKTFLDACQSGPQTKLNTLKQEYLNHYYQNVLNFSKRPSEPEHAHTIVALKKQVSSLLITPDQPLIAGKRADKSEILVYPLEESLINQSQVVEKRSIYRSQVQPGQIKAAQVADSSDGLGEAFADDQDSWYGFGYEALPDAETGFALASEILHLSEGKRQIDITLTLTSAITGDAITLSELFKIHLSSEKGWTDARYADAVLSGNKLTVSFTIAENEPAITPYQSELHGYQINTDQPVVQLLLNNKVSYPLTEKLSDANIASATISVNVSGVTNLTLSTGSGKVSPDNSFLPFGAQPKAGAELNITSDEIFSKRLKSVTATLNWDSPPSDLATLYSGYSTYYDDMPRGVSNSYFKADFKAKNAYGQTLTARSQSLFHPTDAGVSVDIELTGTNLIQSIQPGITDLARALIRHQSIWARKQFDTFRLINPVLGPVNTRFTGKIPSLAVRPVSDQGLQIKLTKDFFHQAYRNAYVKNVLAVNETPTLSIINEPYTPQLSSVNLSYKAATPVVSFSDNSAQAFADDEISFFHLDCFGQRREHAYQRAQLDYVTGKQVSLMPRHTEEGALLIGLSQLNAGDSCQLLLQVAEGSSDPALKPSTVQWSVLCDNYWKTLSDQQVIFDRSNGLLTSGIVKIVIPKEASTVNTLLPSGLLWLKLSIARGVESVCRLRSVLSNAIEVTANQYDPLPAGTISKFKTAPAEVKSVSQPFDGFSGKPAESESVYTARVSERLRHKDRALTIYDYEALILQRFPNLYRVKAIPHACTDGKRFNWHSPGHVTFLCLPDIKGSDSRNVPDPLRPGTDTQTLEQVREYLDARKAMQAQIHVINPQYLQVRLSFEVRFKQGCEFNYYRDQLQQLLKAYLSPWLNHSSGLSSECSENTAPEFGGRIYKSVVMAFIEKLPFVDFISEVRLQTTTDGLSFSADCCHVSPATPIQIMTSTGEHIIKEASYD